MKQNETSGMQNHPIIAGTYELIEWFAPVIKRLSSAHKFTLGDRVLGNLYTLLEELVLIQYGNAQLWRLEAISGRLDIIRHQVRMMRKFALLEDADYAQVARLLDAIDDNLDGWISWMNFFMPGTSANLPTAH